MEIKVAIFEDNNSLRKSLELLIDSTDGMLCTGAFANANKLVESMGFSEPDVVLMDINMPGISGIEAVQLIREKFVTTQILMQTVFDDNDKIFAAICAGASGYLLKKTPPKKKKKAEQVSLSRPCIIVTSERPQPSRLPGSTLTPGPMVEETATRWM